MNLSSVLLPPRTKLPVTVASPDVVIVPPSFMVIASSPSVNSINPVLTESDLKYSTVSFDWSNSKIGILPSLSSFLMYKILAELSYHNWLA